MSAQKRFYTIDQAGKMEITPAQTIEELYDYIDNVYTGGPVTTAGETIFHDITNRPPGF